MDEKVNDIAKKLSRLNDSELSALSATLLHEYDINATIYRFAPISDRSDYNLVLLETGERRLMLIKNLREVFNIGLREAKDFVDNAPCILKQNLMYSEANDIRELLEKHGAILEIN